MNRKRLGIASTLVLVGAMAMAGCSSATTTSDTSTAPAQPTAPSSQSSQGCSVADVSGQSKNPELQALAMEQYNALDCAGDLGAQLTALGVDPALAKQVKLPVWMSRPVRLLAVSR